MLKKFKITFFLVVVFLFTLTLPIYAREMTIDELGSEALKKVPETSYVYIIGKYAFTSTHILTTQDVMLAARSIEATEDDGNTNEDEIYNKMSIFEITPKSEFKDGKIVVTGWEKGKDILGGNTTLNDKLNIKYIDYDYVYDIVDTDKLLEEAERTINEGTKSNGYYYDVDFDKDNKTLTFNVYDLNKKNSEIKGTGLIADIVNIVNEDNVKSIKVSNGKDEETVEFGKEDVNNGTDSNSNAWKQFALLLCKLTGKTDASAENALEKFKDITLGDLVNITDNINLTITLDEKNVRSQNNNVEEEYKIEFLYNAPAKVTLPSEDEDFTEFNYILQDTYQMEEKDGLYNVKGYVTKQEDVNGFGDSKTGFYFAYTITLDEGVENLSNVKVKVPKVPNPTNDDDYNIVQPDSNKVTVLMEVEKSEVGDKATNGYRDIIVEVDGVPTKIRINFKDLGLRENSKSTVEKPEDECNQKLKEEYSWEAPKNYNIEYTTEEDTVKVKGLLPIFDSTGEKLPFGDNCETGYYIAFAIKTKNQKADATTVKITDGTETISWGNSNFDTNDTIYMLKHLHPDADSKTFTIEVDMDGEGTEYEPYTITVDWSELKLQVDSVATLTLNNDEKDNASEADRKTMSGWGYTKPEGQSVTLENGMLKGKLIEQELTSEDAFGKDNKDGFYFDFTIQHPEGVKLNKDAIEITRVKSHTDIGEDLKPENVIKEFTSKDIDDNNNLTILYRFPKDTISCTKCAGKETCDGSCCGKEDGVCDRVLYYVVDWDGAEGNEFLPVVYSIDYCGVTFQKSSIFTVESLKQEDASSKFPFDDKGKWYDTEHGYSVNVAQDETDATKYKVTGVLPIFDDTADEEYKDHFNTEENLYYLGLLLKANNPKGIITEGDNKLNVKFFHNNEEDNEFLKIEGEEINTSGELYILKALEASAKGGAALTEDQKVFTITVDLDGEGNEYTPYTVTVDWSGLKLQDTSRGDFGNYEVATSDNISSDNAALEELDKYGYNFETSKDVQIKTESQEDHEAKVGLKGTIREQSLTEGFTNNTGYFVPVKIEFPGNGDDSLSEYSHKWKLILNTEKGEEKTYTPTQEEYEQGWVLVLFRIEKEGEHKIKYKIDFDGDEFAFLPEEYTINYEDLNFETENKIIYKYKDNKGNEQTEEKVVYENEIVDLKDLKDMNNDYRTFDGWYKDGENISEAEDDFKTGANQDVELTAHWNLNVDKFVEDVIADLKNPDSTYSKNFNEQFELEQKADNEITINVESPNVKISTLAETSIPGTIAYILQKGEIKDITLTVGDSTTKTFNKEATSGDQISEDNTLDEAGKALKQKVITEAKDAFNTELQKLNANENDATMDQVEFEGTSFKLKIGDPIDDTINLVDANGEALAEGKDTYTFKFDSDFAVIDENDPIGPDNITEALSKNDYGKIYVESDVTEENTIAINTNKDAVTIEPIENASKENALMSVTEAPKHTITVNNKDYAVDVQSTGEGTLTIKDLKITGGKRAELKIEDNTNVVVDNIDVSGEIDPAKSREDEMNASIIVKGNLTATNVKNDNESYELPTIAVITDYAYPNSKEPEHAEDTNPTTHLSTNATVKADSMTVNKTYCLVDKTRDPKFHYSKETYYGSFYYNDPNNSKIYFMGIMDSTKDPHPYDYIQIYYYGDQINIGELGYVANTSPTKDETVFTHFYIGNDKENIINDSTQLVQDKLDPHTTNVLHAVYGSKPVAALNFEEIPGLSTSGNKVSGTISTQNEDKKFVIPVTLTSEKFQDNVSTVKVTDPNEEETDYTYTSSNENGIAKVNNEKVIKLELEAIKSSKIKGDNGKVYKIAVDIDGTGTEYSEEVYTVDYNDVQTLAEVINAAAEKTQAVNSLTVKRENEIKGTISKDTTTYDKATGRRLVKNDADEKNGESYTFNKSEIDPSAVTTTKINVEKNMPTDHSDSPILGDWRYNNSFTKIGYGVFELELLRDITAKNENEVIEAIKTIEKTEDDKTYKITINKDRFNKWLNTNYVDFDDVKIGDINYTSDTDIIELEVKLSDDGYISSIKTLNDFNIKGTDLESTDNNKINITMSDFDNTTVESPFKVILARDEDEESKAQLQKFIKDGADWWDKNIHNQQ